MSQAGPLDILSAHPEIPTSFPTNAGTAVPIANVLEILGDGSIVTTGAANIVTIELSGLTDHNVLIGQGTTSIGLVAPSATSGVPLISQGAAADPIFGTAVVEGGGTGATSFTAYAPVCGGTTSTGPLQSADTGIATPGFILTSNGAAALPSFQAAPAGGVTIDGDSGSASGTTISLLATPNCGSSVSFSAAASTVNLNVTDASYNTIIGLGSGNVAPGSANIGLGYHVLQNISGGSTNIAIGNFNLLTTVNSSSNIAIGDAVMRFLAASLGSNIGIGAGALFLLTTGDSNICLGSNAGSTYNGSESSNINIGNVGVLADNNTIRIGTQGNGSGQQDLCYIAGIAGVTIAGSQFVTIDPATGQLGAASSGISAWSTISANQTLAVNNGYICVSPGGALSLALPATSSLGDIIEITLDGATSFTITQSAGQQIRIGNQTTTAGVGGSIASTNQGDTIRMVCQTANLKWNVLSTIGNLTVV